MVQKPEVLAIIPARGGSKGIPLKNIAPCAGKPLVAWTLEAAYSSVLIGGFEGIAVSTDSKRIRDTLADYTYEETLPVRCHMRSADLATDGSPTEATIESVLEWHGKSPDIIVLLQPTSPVRTGKQIDEAIQLLIDDKKADSVVSMTPSHSFLWRNRLPINYEPWKRPMRQAITAPQYEENGSIYVFTRDCWERYRNRIGRVPRPYVMPEECRIQVDTPFDLFLAEKILERQHANRE